MEKLSYHKKELTEKIRNNIILYEGEDPNVRKDALSNTIKLCREYKEVVNEDYKHRFSGSIISFSEALLEELEVILNKLNENN
ncbi:MAG: hypothetical protein PF569_00160 [Candidatus Woesearchaeota archaeon]|jgi:hypothetical protein|nr:hypothetical protein [Candidatus Woesearchaeota archaeon]